MNSSVIKVMYIFLGSLSLGIGVLGIFVPGLPTTPFLLLSAGLYIRGSRRMHRWLVNNRILGGYIQRFSFKRGIPLKTKIRSIILMWTMISGSCIFWVKDPVAIVIIVLAGVTGTVVMGFVLPTSKTPID